MLEGARPHLSPQFVGNPGNLLDKPILP